MLRKPSRAAWTRRFGPPETRFLAARRGRARHCAGARAPLGRDLEAPARDLGEGEALPPRPRGGPPATCTCKATLAQPNGEPKTATGTYRWDGAKGSLRWDDPAVGALLARQGWSVRSFDSLFRDDIFLNALRPARLTAKPDGKGTTVVVDGAPGSGFTSLRFDADGVLASAKGPALSIDWHYERAGDHYLLTGWTITLAGGARDTARVTYGRQGPYRVWKKVEMESGAQTFLFETYTMTLVAYEPAK